MSGRWSSFRATARRRNGYLAVPASGSGPCVIVPQEWWGLVDHIKQVADRFAPRRVRGARPAGITARARRVLTTPAMLGPSGRRGISRVRGARARGWQIYPRRPGRTSEEIEIANAANPKRPQRTQTSKGNIHGRSSQ